MTIKRALELMQIEKECVSRGDTCGRDCGNCELVQDTDELLEAYDKVITTLKKRNTKGRAKKKSDSSAWDFHWNGHGDYEESRRCFYGDFG